MDTTRISLLLRIRDRKDRAAWEQFDAIYRPMLRRFARSAGLSDADCEDVVQHCMTAIHSHIDSFEYDPQKGRFKSFLATIVRNRIRTLRGRARERPADSAVFAAQVADEPLPDETFEQIWMQEHLRRALLEVEKRVEPVTYGVFRDHALLEHTTDETCAKWSVTPENLSRIKWRLTQMLQEELRTLLEASEGANA